MYNRIANQAESLKGLWAAKMNLKGKASLATDEDLVSYENKLEALEIELERRRDIGRRFEAILNKQKELMMEDEQGREKHQVKIHCLSSNSRNKATLLFFNNTKEKFINCSDFLGCLPIFFERSG